MNSRYALRIAPYVGRGCVAKWLICALMFMSAARAGDIPLDPKLHANPPEEQAFTASIQNALSQGIAGRVGASALSEEQAASGYGCHPALQAFSWEEYLSPPGSMGACSAPSEFAVAGAVEASLRIFHGRDERVSRQWMINCSQNSCATGGWIAEDLRLLSEYGGVSEESEPYAERESLCSLDRPIVFRVVNWGYVDQSGGIPSNSAMKHALCAYGPLVATIYASPLFSRYRDGVFSEERESSSRDVNHAILLYGWDDTEEAWLIRNSWGQEWGVGGDAKVRFGNNNIGFAATWIQVVPARAEDFEELTRESGRLRGEFEASLARKYKEVERVPDNVIKRSLGSYLGVR